MRRNSLTLFCLVAVLPAFAPHATPQDSRTDGLAAMLDGPFMVVGIQASADGDETVDYRVVTDSSQPVSHWSTLQDRSASRTLSGLTADLKAAGDLAGRDEATGVSVLAVVLVVKPEMPWRALHDAIAATAVHAGAARIFVVVGGPADRRQGRALMLPVDSGIGMSPTEPGQHLSLSLHGVPGEPEAATFVPEPQTNPELRPSTVESPRHAEIAARYAIRGMREDLTDRVQVDVDAAVQVRLLDGVLAAIQTHNRRLDDDEQPLRLVLRALPDMPAVDETGPQELALGRGTAESVRWLEMAAIEGIPEPPQIVPDDGPEDPDTDAEPGEEPPVGFDNDPWAGGSGRPAGFTFRARSSGRAPVADNVQAALRWLRDHQHEDGYWDPVAFGEAGAANDREGEYGNRDGSEDGGWQTARVGITGLATLAFLGAGHTHSEGEFRNTVRRAIHYLKSVQDNEGYFGTDRQNLQIGVYNHAIGTMAVAEAYAMTGSLLLKTPAQKAVDFIATARNRDDLDPRARHGWRYGVRPGDSDSSVTGWMLMALKSATIAGLEVPDRCVEGGLGLLEDMTGASPEGYPKTGYNQRAGGNARLAASMNFEQNGTMDAMHVLAKVTYGASRRDRVLRAQSDQLIDNAPSLADPDRIDYYYWYVGSQALFQMGRPWWQRWEGAMKDALVESQRLGDNEADACHGSWDTVSAWGVAGGRVYTTAINCLTLQTYYRYERVD